MYKEVCKLYWGEVQEECIRHNWYTRGTNAQFESLQKYVWNNAGDQHNIATENYVEWWRTEKNRTDIRKKTILTYGKSCRYL